jgi:hypothetical protein
MYPAACDPRGIVALGGRVFWGSYGCTNTTDGTNGLGAIWTMAEDGSDLSQISMNVLTNITDVIVHGSVLAGINRGPQSSFEVWTLAIDESNPDALKYTGVSLQNLKSLGGIAMDDQSLYFTEPTSSRVASVLIKGPSPFSLISTTASQPGPIAVDPSGVYWADMGSGEMVVKRPADSAPVSLALESKAKRIALDATHVYWTTDDGHVRKVHK